MLEQNKQRKWHGYQWVVKSRRWCVYLHYKRRTIYGGSFINEIDAARAADKMVKRFNAPRALNFPESENVK